MNKRFFFHRQKEAQLLITKRLSFSPLASSSHVLDNQGLEKQVSQGKKKVKLGIYISAIWTRNIYPSLQKLWWGRWWRCVMDRCQQYQQWSTNLILSNIAQAKTAGWVKDTSLHQATNSHFSGYLFSIPSCLSSPSSCQGLEGGSGETLSLQSFLKGGFRKVGIWSLLPSNNK